MYNQVTLVGNVGGKPELKHTPQGVAICEISMAVNKKWTASDGQKRDKTLWVKVKAWREQGEVMYKYLDKGSKILVVGELEEPDAWSDRESGKARAKLIITAHQIKFLGGGSGGGSAPTSGDGLAEMDELEEEDIPF